MNNPAAESTTLVVKRFIAAPPERLFAAWTNPEDLKIWFGPEECHLISGTMDIRVGGEYHLKVDTGTMGQNELRGVYREVAKPGKLVFTWNWSGHAMLEFGETLVTVLLNEAEGGTDVHLIHENFPAPQIRDNHNHGWNGCFDKLAKMLGGPEAGCAGKCEEETKFPVGAVCWNELLTSDTGAAGAFYGKLFGWEGVTFPDPAMKYTVLKHGARDIGGMGPLPNPAAPPHWLPYVRVENTDAALKLAGELGGRTIAGPLDIPMAGRIAVIIDPQGAIFGVVQPPAAS
jgi:uncharacterized protein YndB with AHSA1/START domain/predicted enzyme related to lactoylglutathione lyase